MTVARALDRTPARPAASPTASPSAALAALDPRARRTVVAWRLRRSLARRITRL